MAGEIEYDILVFFPEPGATVIPPPLQTLKEGANKVGEQRWEICFPCGKDGEGNTMYLCKRPKLLIHLAR